MEVKEGHGGKFLGKVNAEKNEKEKVGGRERGGK